MSTFAMQETAAVIVECQKERNRRPLHDPSPACVEVIRRAFAGDESAWHAFCEIFDSLMRKWVNTQNYIEADDVVQDALVAFFRFAPKAPTLLVNDDLSPVLSYLRSCVKSALLRALREEARRVTVVDGESILDVLAGTDEIVGAEIRVILAQVIPTLLHTELERYVYHLRFECGVKPQEIFDENREHFTNYDELAQIIQRITRRLRKNAQLVNLRTTRQKAMESTFLKVSFVDPMEGGKSQMSSMLKYQTCAYQEDLLLDYITGLASAELRAAIEASPACMEAAKLLANDVAVWLPYLYRLSCPSESELVAYQQREISGTAYMILQKHMAVCPSCRAELDMLAAIDAVPISAPATGLRRLIEALPLPALAMPQPVRGTMAVYQTPQLLIHISTRRSAGDVRTWVLRGQLRTPKHDVVTSVDAILLQDLADPSVPEVQSMIDDNGFFVFKDLPRGYYQLRVLTATEEISIRRIPLGVE